MKLLVLNTSDVQGGAALATYRLHQGLRRIGLDSVMYVQGKTTDDFSVIGPKTVFQKIMAKVRPHLDALPVRACRIREKQVFSSSIIPDSMASEILKINPDIVHLFWVTAGFIRPETLRKIKKPIVWTLHDMWPFTGGCHYDEECGKYRQSCGACPILHSSNKHDLSSWIWKRKHNAWKQLDITVVATSHWIAECARSSSLFGNCRIEVLPNGIDVSKYKPIDKTVARQAYGLPQDKQLILFCAGLLHYKRKGLQFLIPTLRSMAKDGLGDRCEVVILGASEPKNATDIGLKTHYMGRLYDEISQVLLYSAADVLVVPSVQENLSNTVVESLACGTPVVAFNIGGMPDMIRHKGNGYLAEPFSSEELAEGIKWVLQSRLDRLSQQARDDAVNQYALEHVAAQVQTLYKDILE